MPDSSTYVFRPDVRVVVHDADTVEIRTGVWNTSSVTVADDTHKGILAEIILGLLRRESHRTLTRRNGIASDDIAGVIEALLPNGVLVPEAAAARWSPTSYAAMRTIGLGKADREIPSRAVLVAPESLRTLFTEVLAGAEKPKVSAAEDGLVERLMEEDIFLEADGLSTVDAASPFSQWAGDLVVALWPNMHPILLANLNKLAHYVGFVFGVAIIDGPFAIVGPVIVPGISACFACAEARVLEAMRDHTLYTQYRSALAEGRVSAPPQPDEMNPFLALIVSLAAWETSNLLAVGSAFTVGKIMTVYAPTMEITFHELTMMPGCPVCGTSSAMDEPLYADLQAYLSARLGEKLG